MGEFMGRRTNSVLALALLPVFVVGCSGATDLSDEPPSSTMASSANDQPAPDAAVVTTDELGPAYLNAVCSAGLARALLYYRVEGLLTNQASTFEQVTEAIPGALDAGRSAVAFFNSPPSPWPAGVADDVAAVSLSEAATLQALETAMQDVDASTLAAAWQVFKDRPKDDSEAGSRARTFFGLGVPGDCPAGPLSNDIFLAVVLNLSPTLKSKSPEEVLGIGQQACSMMAAELGDADRAKELSSMGLTDFTIGVVDATARSYLCPLPIGEVAAAPEAVVDTILDHFIKATGILTFPAGETTSELLLEWDVAVEELTAMKEELDAGVPGVPTATTESVSAAAQDSIESLSEGIACYRDDAQADCSATMDAAGDMSFALGKATAALIPFGSRSNDEVLGLLQASPAAEAPSADPGESAETPTSADMSVSQEQAIKAAEAHLDSGHFSAKGLLEQLTSEYGEGFPEADAAFAIAYLDPDWNAEARDAAAAYLESGSFSRNSLMEQLTSEYGEQFTQAQAAQAVESVGL